MFPFVSHRTGPAGLIAGVISVLFAGLFLSVPLASPHAEMDGLAGQPWQLATLDREDAGADTGSPDIPWSEVVRDIQKELRDLGLYNGPEDGRYSAEVKNAIERFERLHGRIGEGTPLTDALRSIVSVRDALHLRRNLDEIRKRQTDQALQALRANPDTRDLVDSEKSTRGKHPKDTSDCGNAVSVDCLLADAREAAAQVEQTNFHDWALREIILTEVRTGRSSDAVRTRLRQLSDPRLVLVAMREVSEALGQDGRIEDALALAETIPDSENQIRAFASIAISAGAQGDKAGARGLARRVMALLEKEDGLAARVAIASALASGLAQGGDVDAATDVIRAARRFASPQTASLIRHAEVGLLTGTLTESGEYGEAAEALQAMANETGAAMIASSASAVSRAAFAEGDRYRVTTLCNLAVVQAKAGNQTAAVETIAKAARIVLRVRAGYPRDYAQFSVALAWAHIGKFDKSNETLEAIDSELLRAEGYWRVTEVAARVGNVDAAGRFETLALGIATNIENRFDRAIMLGDMAVVAARAGRTAAARRLFGDALHAGRGLDAGWWRARALARLATTLHVVAAAEAKQ